MNYARIIAAGACLFVAIVARGELPATIITTDGQTYEGVTLIRTEPDGFLVNYHPAKDGAGIAKIKFTRLSADQQQQGGYNPETAKNFEADLAKAREDAAKASAQYGETASKERLAREVREAQQDQATQRTLETGRTRRADVYGAPITANGVASTTYTYWGPQLVVVPRVHVAEPQRPSNTKIFQAQRATAAAAAPSAAVAVSRGGGHR